ncbi:uncharacterized protein C7orf50 [Adelges cooleyi]|uniref:uncharacterized protein C7orf50 n=1 Tax=Adelges cooleyi TaxID=133065 RepID=UPI00217F2A3D|nr:uncharacterized protein C7orf50 [Adelges cooleyi]
MSVKSILKNKIKKLKSNNPFGTIKSKKHKSNNHISEKPLESYVKINTEECNNDVTCNNPPKKNAVMSKKALKLKVKKETKNDDQVIEKEKPVGKRKSVEIHDDECTPSKKLKHVTFADDVKSEADDKCSAGKLKPLSLNKRKKRNYIKKLKSKKNKLKNAKKQEENANATITPRQERAIEYLLQWKNDRSNWKFKKIFQLWLIKNIYNPIKINKEDFDILVEYLQTIKGKSHEMILENANATIAEYSQLDDSQEDQDSAQHIRYQRARNIIQSCD